VNKAEKPRKMLHHSGVEKSIQNSILFMNSILGERKKLEKKTRQKLESESIRTETSTKNGVQEFYLWPIYCKSLQL
jgi:hypothetical protein